MDDSAMDVSIVTACMNREENLLKAIPTWLELEAREVVIVDWSCKKRITESLKQHGIDDPRIQIVRVEDEDRWILTHAYNVGLKQAVGDIILKLDNDHTVSRDFLERNTLEDLDCRLGSWRLANSPEQAYVNGAFLAKSPTLRKVGFFNELITTYGWDDSYLHESLFADGARIGHIDPESIYHLEQEHATRTKNQKVSEEQLIAESLGKDTTEFMNRRNMYLSALLPRQDENSWQSKYQITHREENVITMRRIRDSRPDHHLPSHYMQLANRLAFRDFHCWGSGMSVIATSLDEIESQFSKALGQAANRTDANETEARSSKAHPLDSRLDEKNLWEYLPLALSAYGHTDNSQSYFIRLTKSPPDIDKANEIIPGFCKPKVCFVPAHSDPPKEAVEIKVNRNNRDRLVAKLLFDTEESNKYFWAAYNSLLPRYKRSLYEMIEYCSSPLNLLKDYIQSNLDVLTTTGRLPRFLRAATLISPKQGTTLEACLGTELYREVVRRCDSPTDGVVEITPANTDNLEEFSLTLITSLFKGSKYIVSYALNIKRMNLFSKTEVIIYIVPSPEAKYCFEYLRRFFVNDTNVVIELLDTDPGLYQCWNMGAKRSRARYISNANVDDRRGKYHSDALIALAEINECDAVSSALVADAVASENRYTDTQDIWFTGMGRTINTSDLAITKDGRVESQNFLHCMPIWRHDLHEKIGNFDELTYGTSADWEFWLRACASECKMQIASLPLGFYLVDLNSHNRRHSDKEEKESLIVSRYLSDLATRPVS
jgi:glycosyltransferase involved in cell wall biosynthesis